MRRLLARLGLKFTELSIVVVSLAVAAMGASTLVALQRSADEARRAELLVVRIGESATNLHELTTQALASGVELEGLEVHRPTLEDVYLELVEEEAAPE